jgi:predicted ATPase
MRRCTENNLFMVAGVTRAYFLALLAEAQLGTEDFAGALETIKSALDDVERHRMRFWEPELYRLRGDSLRRLPQPNLQRVERCFRRARDTAREQGARLLELRAVVSLARLLTACGRRSEAALELAPLVREFDEAPAVSDVLEARRVLQGN